MPLEANKGEGTQNLERKSLLSDFGSETPINQPGTPAIASSVVQRPVPDVPELRTEVALPAGVQRSQTGDL